MRCPLHIGTEMVCVESKRPFVSVGGHAAHTQAQRAKRMVWECPIEGCPRVQAAEDENADELDEDLGE